MCTLGDFCWSYDRLSNLHHQLEPLPQIADPHIQQPDLESALGCPMRHPKHSMSHRPPEPSFPSPLCPVLMVMECQQPGHRREHFLPLVHDTSVLPCHAKSISKQLHRAFVIIINPNCLPRSQHNRRGTLFSLPGLCPLSE